MCLGIGNKEASMDNLYQKIGQSVNEEKDTDSV